MKFTSLALSRAPCPGVERWSRGLIVVSHRVLDLAGKPLGEEVGELVQQGFVGAIRWGAQTGYGWGRGPAATMDLAGGLVHESAKVQVNEESVLDEEID